MKSIDIARTLVAKRGEKGITQDELANFIGVSKASVSKWEKGHSYPDITFLPQLAAYFGISIDELMGYVPQMTDDDIRKLYKELLKEFAEKPLDDVMNRCRDIIKNYFSCFPLLFQIGVLFSNYGSTVKDEEKKASIMIEAKELFIRVKTLSDSIELKQLALRSEAACEMMLGNANEVIALLEDEGKYSFHPSVGAMRSQAHQMLGEIQEAKITLQDSILDSTIALFFDITSYLPVCTDDADHFEEICRRTMAMDEVFGMERLFPIAILPFYLTAAEGYLTLGNTKKALSMLEAYAQVATGDIFPLAARGDNFFTLIDELYHKHLSEYPHKMPEASLDEGSIKQDMVDAVIHNPAFSILRESQQFRNLVKELKKIL